MPTTGAKKAGKAKKSGAKAKPKATASKPRFGRPGTAGKAEGDAAVRTWMKTVKPEHREIVERLDALIEQTVPGVKRAVKWSMPMYGVAGQGWFAHVASFKTYVALGFFRGTELKPPPPEGEGKGMRRINIRSLDEIDAALFRKWIQQASSMPGWGKS